MEFKIVKGDNRIVTKENRTRAYPLSNHDVIQVYDMLLEYEDRMLYEVERVVYDNKYIVYKRTGKSFTPEEINKIVVDNHNK